MSNGDLDLNQVSLPDLVNQHINNAADLLMVSSRLLPGDRIDLFFTLAANRPEVAFSAFMTILEGNADPTYRALALRGLGRIQHEPTLNEIRACESDDARELVQFLAAELKGQGSHSNDLTRWAAKDAMVNIGYLAPVLQMTGLGGVGESLERIAKEIVESYLAKGLRVERFDSQGETTAEYERFLDFWTFGPVERLFQEEMIHASDESMLLQELSFLGLEIILRIKKACYNTAIRNVSEAFSSHNNNSHGAYSLRLTRFLNGKIPDSMVVQTINDVREVIRGDFVAPPNLDVTQQNLNNKTEGEIISMISFFEKNIAVTERNLEDLLVRVNGELMEDFLEKRFLLRQDWFSRNKGVCESVLDQLREAKEKRLSQKLDAFDRVKFKGRSIDERLSAVHKLIDLIKSTLVIELPEWYEYDLTFKSADSLYTLEQIISDYKKLRGRICAPCEAIHRETVISLHQYFQTAESQILEWHESVHSLLPKVKNDLIASLSEIGGEIERSLAQRQSYASVEKQRLEKLPSINGDIGCLTPIVYAVLSMIGTWFIHMIMLEQRLLDEDDALGVAFVVALAITLLLFILFSAIMRKIAEDNKRDIETRFLSLKNKCQALSELKSVVFQTKNNLVSLIDKV